MVHKHAGELAAHRLGHQCRGHRGIHAAREGQQHLAGAHLLPNLTNGGLLIISHGPVTPGSTYLIEEVADHAGAILGVVDLGVELDTVETAALVTDGHVGAGVGVGHQREPIRYLLHIVPVAHPGNTLCGQVPEKLAAGVEKSLGLAVLPGGVGLGRGDTPPQIVS